jgi:hypothetical protein
LSDHGELLRGKVIDGEEVWAVDFAAAAARGAVVIPVAILRPGHTLEIEFLVQAVRSGLLTLAAEVESGQTVVAADVTELAIVETFEKRVTIRRPGRLCGVGTMPLVLVIGLMLARRTATGRRVHRRGACGA